MDRRFVLAKVLTPMARPRGRTRQLALEISERIIAKEGVDALKLKDIAEEIGIQVPSLYKHFHSRDDILISISAAYIAALAVLFEIDTSRSTEANLIAGIQELVELFAQHPAWMRLQLRDYSSVEGTEALSRYTGGIRKLGTEGQLGGFVKRLEKLLKSGVRSGDFRSVQPLDFSNILFGTLCFQVASYGGKVLTGRQTQRLQAQMVDTLLRYVKA
jgi:AcrR family transcriptional regulator